MNIKLKRIICILLVISLMFTLTGCADLAHGLAYIGTGTLMTIGTFAIYGLGWVINEITEPLITKTGWCVCQLTLDMAVAWAKFCDPNELLGSYENNVVDQVDFHDDHVEILAGLESEKGGSDRFLAGNQSSGKKECVIHYDAAGGYDPPGDQTIKTNSLFVPKIDEKMPVRPGYHFVGWTTNPLGTNPNHFPGKKVDANTGIRFRQDTTLYAVWEEHSDSFIGHTELEHKFTIIQKNTGLYKETPYLTVKCSCGMTITDTGISYPAFKKLLEKEVKSEHELKKLHQLFQAQYIAPFALKYNTSLYLEAERNTEKIDSLFASVEALSEKTGKVSTAAGLFADIPGGAQVKGSPAERFFESVHDCTEKASLAVGLFHAANACGTMTNADNGIAAQTAGMLDLIECISSFADVDDAVSPIVEVLKAGLSLMRICSRRIGERNMLYESAWDTVKLPSKPYISHLFPNQDFYLALDQMTTGSELGCNCGTDASGKEKKCDFNTGYLKNYPGVLEVLSRMDSCPSHIIPDEQEKEMVLFYLAERSKHELYQLSHLTLDEYVSIIE